MFLIKSDGSLNGGVGEDVAVGKVFGYDPRARFVFLRDLSVSAATKCACNGLFGRSCNVRYVGGGRNLDLRRA